MSTLRARLLAAAGSPDNARMVKLAAVVLALCSSAALAHIELVQPQPRYANTLGEVNKNCPCGGGGGGQTCTAGVTSDPNRDESRATAVAPGSTITVKWKETIDHTGRFRIAFDDDGADLADFNANILADIADPANTTGDKSAEVTLPSTPCDNCTLQLIQDMNGDDVDAVADPTGDPTYFQCADLVLKEGAPTDLGGGCAAVPGAAPSVCALALALCARRRLTRWDRRRRA